MADQPQEHDATKTEQQRVERVRALERKRHAETTAALLRQRYVAEDE